MLLRWLIFLCFNELEIFWRTSPPCFYITRIETEGSSENMHYHSKRTSEIILIKTLLNKKRVDLTKLAAFDTHLVNTYLLVVILCPFWFLTFSSCTIYTQRPQLTALTDGKSKLKCNDWLYYYSLFPWINISCSLLNSEMMLGVPTFSLRTVVASAVALLIFEKAENA